MKNAMVKLLTQYEGKKHQAPKGDVQELEKLRAAFAGILIEYEIPLTHEITQAFIAERDYHEQVRLKIKQLKDKGLDADAALKKFLRIKK